MNTPSVGTLLDFVMEHKTNKTFLNMTPAQIAGRLFAAIPTEELYYSVDVNGRIDGMILAELDKNKKYCWVSENLALTLANLRKFAQKFHDRYPDFTLEWKKNGKDRHFNTQKVYQKLGVI